MEPSLSIIVPVYNAELYLKECVKSILVQDYLDFELILVDDGSPDSSGAICDEYAQKNNRIRVIHQANSGVTSARAAGVKTAIGKWITFVDADDSLPSGALNLLMSKTANNTDIVVGKIDGRNCPTQLTIKEYRGACISGSMFHSGPYARAFRASLFNENTFDIPRNIKVGEDLIMNVRLSFASTKDPSIINKIIYTYRNNEGSVMHTYRYKTVDELMTKLKCLKSSIPDSCFEQYRNDYNYYVWRLISALVYSDPANDFWRNSQIHNYLKNEIKEGRFKMSLSQHLSILPRNRVQLRIVNWINRIIS